MNIVTDKSKKNNHKKSMVKQTLKNLFSMLASPLQSIKFLSNNGNKIVCNKCNFVTSAYKSCSHCGYKPLTTPEIKKSNRAVGKFSNAVGNRKYETYEVNEKLAYVSDIGERHHENQDSGFVKLINDWKFLGVSDGVSRSNYPKIASEYALKKSYEYLRDIQLNTNNIEDEIKNAIHYAHTEILKIKLDKFDPEIDPPEATIVIALVKDNQAFIGWVGDSRAYTIDKKQTQLITRDDSWVMYAVDKGMSFKEANNSPMAHAITQCMGMQDILIIPHVVTVDLSNKDLLLCSDGLWNYFDDELLMHDLYNRVEGSAKDIGHNLVQAANIKGGNDNITVSIYKNQPEY